MNIKSKFLSSIIKNKINIFILFFALLFSFNVGLHKTEAAITFGNNGTFQGGTGALTVPVPSTYAVGDLLMLLVESANEAIATPSGWTQVASSPQYAGVAASAGGVRVAAFYKIATASESSVTVADSGNHTTAVMINFKGVDTSTPIDVTSGTGIETPQASMSFTSVTTTTANDMIVLVSGIDTDANSTATVSGWTNANLTSLTERIDQTINSGAGGGLAIATGLKATVGAVGATTATGSTSVNRAYLTIALKPIPDSIPTLSSPTATNIFYNKATLGANLASLGYPSTILARGTCWGTTSNPTTNCLSDGGTSTGVYTQIRTGLACNTTYYYRGYATNTTGTNYSPDGTFTTSACPVLAWKQQINSPYISWNSLAASDDGTKLVATTTSSLYTSTDSGVTWTERVISGTHNYMSTASSSDGVNLVVADNNGYMYTSTDSGVNWTQRTSLNAVGVASSSDGTKLVAVNGTYIYTSTDSGASWILRTAPSSGYWDSVASSSDGTKLVAVVNGGYIYTSTDSGINWTQQTASGSRVWNSVASSSDGTKLVAVVNGGYIYTSTDSGINWTQQTAAGSRAWNNIFSSADGSKLVAGVSGGYIYTSTDSGATWTEQTVVGSGYWAVASSSDGLFIFAGNNTDYFYSYNAISAPSLIKNGVNATSSSTVVLNAIVDTDHTIHGFEYGLTTSYGSQTSSTGTYNLGLYSSSSITVTPGVTYHYRAYATNSIGTSYSSDGIFVLDYQTWTEQTNSGARNWYSIASSSDGTKLAAVTYGGYIYTSIDSGATWTERITSGSRNWRSIASSSDGTKLAAAASGGYIYTSIDSGATWTEQTNSGSRTWYSIASSSDGTKLVASVYPGYLYTSTDSGVTWTQQGLSSGWPSVASSSDGTKLVAVRSGGYIYTSTNSGVNWTAQTSSGIRSWKSVFSSSDGTKLVAVATDDYIYTSIDSGVTWTKQESAGDHKWISVSSSSDGVKIVAVNNGGYVYISTDSGNSWIAQTNPGSRLWNSANISSNGVRVVIGNGSSGYIYSYRYNSAPEISSTTAASSITQTTASSGGTISYNGGSVITASGVVWNTTGSPTISDSKTTDNATSGTFISSLTGLTLSTTYYVRAYATNSIGTGYGNEITFSTLGASNPNATSITNTNEGTITDGARIGQTVTITGTDFGTVSAGSRANCAGGVGTGCIKIGGTGGQTISDSNITAWTNTSITLTLTSGDINSTFGGATTAGLIVYAAGLSDTDGATFYVYPNITSVTVPGGNPSDSAREGESVTLNGTRFNTSGNQGTVTFTGNFGSVSATITSWSDTAVTVTVPTAIADNIYTGDITLTRTAATGSKTALAYGGGGSSWYNASWSYRKKITIDGTKVQGTNSNFPILVSLTDSGLTSYANSSGSDIVFTSSDATTKLDYEIERFDKTSGVLVAWVRIPSLVSGSNQDIYMYYGNASATDGQNKTGVWDTYYKGVWHLGDAATSTTISESTSNNLTSTRTDSTHPNVNASGSVGYGQSFEGTTSRIGVSGTTLNNLATAVTTWEFWQNQNSTTVVMGKSDNNVNSGWYIRNGSPTNMKFERINATNNTVCSIPISASTWQHIVWVFNGDTATDIPCTDFTAYVNGSPVTITTDQSGVGATSTDASNPFYLEYNIFSRSTSSYFNGGLDEVRISSGSASAARSANWIKTEYNNQSSPSTFYSVSSQESKPASGSFRILPKIASISTTKGGIGDTGFSITGDHLCQSGTCPTAFSANDKVVFNAGSVTSGASTWTNTSIPSITIPTGATDGNFSIVSNGTYTSNALTFDVKFAPSTPTNTTPANAATSQSQNPALTANAFSDGTDADTHSATLWQISKTSGDYTAGNLVWTRTSASAEVTTTVNNTNGTFTNTTLGTELNCNTRYYWHVKYKDNSAVTSSEWSAYSTETYFDTGACNVAPSITTPTSASITGTGATLGGNITSAGVPATLTARGTCWATTATPRTNCLDDGSTTTGVFTQARTGLTCNTTYYYAAYATNATGTTYTADGTFTTSACTVTMSISGTADSNNGATVKVAVNNTLQAQTTTISGGAWTISGVTQPVVGDIVTVWVDNVVDASESTAVTKWSSGNISGMVLNTNVLSVGSNQNASLTATNLGLYDFDNDEDIMHTSNTGVLLVQGGTNSYTGETLSVLASNTLTVASASSETLTTEKITNAGTLTFTGTPAITLNGTSGTLFTNTGTFNAGSSTVSLTGNGSATIASGFPSFYNLTINSTGTKSPVETLTAIGTLTLTSGTLDTVAGNNYTVNAGWLVINGGTFTPQGSNVNLTGTSGTLFTLSSGTFTSGTSSVNITGSGSSIIASGTPSFYKLKINGSGTKSLGAALTVTDTLTISNGTLDTVSGSNYTVNTGWLVINGGTFTPQASSVNINGTSGTLFTLSSGVFTPGTSTIGLYGNGSTVITSGSPSFYNFNISGGGTKSLGENLVVLNNIVINMGTILNTTTNNYSITSGIFTINTGTLVLNNSIFNLSGIGTVFSYVAGTITPGTSTIKLTNSSSSNKTFAGGGQTYNNLWLAPGAGTGSFTIAGSNTFNNFKDDGTAAHSVLFTAGTTQTVSSWNVSGTAGNLITINSTTTGTHSLVMSGGAYADSDYLNIQHSVVTPVNTWYAGDHSTNNQAVATAGSGWIFTARTIASTYDLSGYRFYRNIDNLDISEAISGESSPTTLSKLGDSFRLRLLIHIGADQLLLNAENFKLQYSPRAGACDNSFVGETYQDVTAATSIAYYDNLGLASYGAVTPSFMDPSHISHTIVNQSYVESNNFTNSIAIIPAGQDGLWDFSLYDQDQSGGASYCFRVVKTDGSLLDSYSQIPEISAGFYINRRGGGGHIESVNTPSGNTGGGTNTGGGGNTVLPFCSDGIDNDGDTLIDTLDPQCHLGGILGNAYVPTHNSEVAAPVINTGGSGGGGGAGGLE